MKEEVEQDVKEEVEQDVKEEVKQDVKEEAKHTAMESMAKSIGTVVADDVTETAAEQMILSYLRKTASKASNISVEQLAKEVIPAAKEAAMEAARKAGTEITENMTRQEARQHVKNAAENAVKRVIRETVEKKTTILVAAEALKIAAKSSKTISHELVAASMEPIKKIGKDVSETFIGQMPGQLGKIVGQISEDVAENAGSQVLKEAAEKAAREAGEDAAKKVVGKVTIEEGEKMIQEASQKAAKQAIDATMENAAEKAFASANQAGQEVITAIKEIASQQAKTVLRITTPRTRKLLEGFAQDGAEKAVLEALEQNVKTAFVEEAGKYTINQSVREMLNSAARKAAKEAIDAALRPLAFSALKDSIPSVLLGGSNLIWDYMPDSSTVKRGLNYVSPYFERWITPSHDVQLTPLEKEALYGSDAVSPYCDELDEYDGQMFNETYGYPSDSTYFN